MFKIVIGLCIGWLLFGGAPEPKPDIEEITVYWAYCPDSKSFITDCMEARFQRHESFRVSFSNQKVVSDFMGGYYDMGDCQVFDAENWHCEQDGEVTSMRDGNYWDSTDKKSLDDNGKETGLPLRYQIGATGYYLGRIAWWFR